MKDGSLPGGTSAAAIRQYLDLARKASRDHPRMIFAMDATASREPTWELAIRLHRDMALALGTIEVQLVFFHGNGKCFASNWASGGSRLADLMAKVQCLSGQTQIAKVLEHVLRESEKHTIRGVVYVGDTCEEELERLSGLAAQMKQRKIPLFIFHEVSGDATGASEASDEILFRALATITDGVYAPFDAGAADQLQRLLRGAADYVSGKYAAVTDVRNVLLIGSAAGGRVS
jgi:hypothetical protein